MHAQRMNYRAASPATYEAIAAAEAHIRKCGLEHSLIELVKMRASQINHCAYCLDRHSKDAREPRRDRAAALPAERLGGSVLLHAARARRARLDQLAHAACRRTGAPDADYEALKGHFTEKEIVDLTVLIGLINLWNRIGVGFRLQHPK